MCVKKLNPRPTRCFYGMTHFAGPAYRVQEGTPHVAPEIRDSVLRGVTLVRIHQLNAAADNRVYDGHAGPTHVFGVHHLHTHTYSERGPHALCQLGRGQKECGRFYYFLYMIRTDGSSFMSQITESGSIQFYLQVEVNR